MTELTSLIVVEESAYEQANMTNGSSLQNFGLVDADLQEIDIGVSFSGGVKLVAAYYYITCFFAVAILPLF